MLLRCSGDRAGQGDSRSGPAGRLQIKSSAGKELKKKLERGRKREAAAAARRETSPEKVSIEDKKQPEGTAREMRAGSRDFQAPLRVPATVTVVSIALFRAVASISALHACVIHALTVAGSHGSSSVKVAPLPGPSL